MLIENRDRDVNPVAKHFLRNASIRAGTKLTLLPAEVDILAAPERTKDDVTTLAETEDRRRIVFSSQR